MGVVNVTPDSFSDGGMWFETDDAVRHGHELVAAGADLVDVGGESTRPGAERPTIEEELRRVLPVVADLSAAGAVVTIDTMRAEVARQAVDVGAAGVNDVSGGLSDPEMLPAVAAMAVPYVCMHWRGPSATMQQHSSYGDVVAEVVTELRKRVDAALTAGIEPGRLVVDPGLGFAKTGEHNWTLLSRLEALHELGQPVLVGASRKTFLGSLLTDAAGTSRSPLGRDTASAVLSAVAAWGGVWCVRVHDVPASLDAVRVAARFAQEEDR